MGLPGWAELGIAFGALDYAEVLLNWTRSAGRAGRRHRRNHRSRHQAANISITKRGQAKPPGLRPRQTGPAFVAVDGSGTPNATITR